MFRIGRQSSDRDDVTDVQTVAPELAERREELMALCQRIVNIARPHVLGERRDPATELMASLTGRARWQNVSMDERRKEMSELEDCDRLAAEIVATLGSVPSQALSESMQNFVDRLGTAAITPVTTQHALAHLLLEDLAAR
jgi:hypothetical protein